MGAGSRPPRDHAFPKPPPRAVVIDRGDQSPLLPFLIPVNAGRPLTSSLPRPPLPSLDPPHHELKASPPRASGGTYAAVGQIPVVNPPIKKKWWPLWLLSRALPLPASPLTSSSLVRRTAAMAPPLTAPPLTVCSSNDLLFGRRRPRCSPRQASVALSHPI